jgi:hypothetical protein
MSVSKVLGVTDLMFHVSDFINDSTAIELFGAQRSFVDMIQRYDRRYKVKKNMLLQRVIECLEDKWDASSILVRKDMIMIEFHYYDYMDVWSYRIVDGTLKCYVNQGHTIKTPRAYATDEDLNKKIEMYLEC